MGNEMNVIGYENLANQLDNKITDYLSLKEGIIDDDYLEVIVDSFSVIKAISSGYKLISKKRLAYFLRGMNLRKEPTFEQLCRLYDYIDSEAKAEFISDSITKVLVSRSKKASFLVGLIIHRIINSKVELTYKELICANALSEMYDFDIDNILIISNYVSYIDEKRKGKNKGWFSIYNEFKKWCKECDINTDSSLVLTVEKCVSSQILIKDIEVELSIDGDDPGSASAYNSDSLKFTEAGELLVSNLKYLDEL